MTYAKLSGLGFNKIHLANSYEEAVIFISGYDADLFFVKYSLDGEYSGLELYHDYLCAKRKPVVFLSSSYNEHEYNDLKSLDNVDLLPLNAKSFELYKSIRLLTQRTVKKIELKCLDFLLVKKGKALVKLKLSEIEYIEVDGKYLSLKRRGESYLIRSTLTEFQNRVFENFIRIHRSFVINVRYMEKICLNNNLVILGDTKLPISRNYKKALISEHYNS